MRKGRPKYKVRWVLGRNAMRCMWKRTEQNRRKWKVKKTGRRVRKSRKVKRMTARNARSNEARLGGSAVGACGGRAPRKGKLKRWRKKKRHGRKGRKRRYGAGYRSEVSTKRRSQGMQQETRRRNRTPRVQDAWTYAYGYMYGSTQLTPTGTPGQDRTVPRDHVRGPWERRAPMRRWRAGRAHTRGEARERRTKGMVRRVGPQHGLSQAGLQESSGETRCDVHRSLMVGEGRQIVEECWKTRKGERRRREFGRSRRSLARKRNGRTGYSYLLVDYQTGVVLVKHKPRSGEVRRPARMERRRWMF